jgi:hypothetical protein
MGCAASHGAAGNQAVGATRGLPTTPNQAQLGAGGAPMVSMEATTSSAVPAMWNSGDSTPLRELLSVAQQRNTIRQTIVLLDLGGDTLLGQGKDLKVKGFGMVHGIRAADGAELGLDPPGPDQSSGTHTYVVLALEAGPEDLAHMWERRTQMAQRLENSARLSNGVAEGSLPVLAARQLQRSLEGGGVLGGEIFTAENAQDFEATVHVFSLLETEPQVKTCKIGGSVLCSA